MSAAEQPTRAERALAALKEVRASLAVGDAQNVTAGGLMDCVTVMHNDSDGELEMLVRNHLRKGEPADFARARTDADTITDLRADATVQAREIARLEQLLADMRAISSAQEVEAAAHVEEIKSLRADLEECAREANEFADARDEARVEIATLIKGGFAKREEISSLRSQLADKRAQHWTSTVNAFVMSKRAEGYPAIDVGRKARECADAAHGTKEGGPE